MLSPVNRSLAYIQKEKAAAAFFILENHLEKAAGFLYIQRFSLLFSIFFYVLNTGLNKNKIYP
jgi:hypothetical protein